MTAAMGPLSTSTETSSVAAAAPADGGKEQVAAAAWVLEDSMGGKEQVAAAADGEATPAAAAPADEAAVEEPQPMSMWSQTPVTIHVWGHPSWKWLGPISRTPWTSPTTTHLHEHGSEFEARSVAP